MNDHPFSSYDFVQVFTFLSQLTEDCDTIYINEAQDSLFLPYLLNATAKYQ